METNDEENYTNSELRCRQVCSVHRLLRYLATVSLKRRPRIFCIEFTVKRLEYNYSSHSKLEANDEKKAHN